MAVHWILPWRHMKSPPARRFPAISGAAARTSSQPPAPQLRVPAGELRLPARDRPRRGRHRALRRARPARALLRPHADPLGRPLDRRVEEWFPFLALVMVLVFWQAGLYAQRERRAGFGRIVSSLVVVALLVLAFGLGTGHDFTTFGLIPTALVIATVLDRPAARELRDDQPRGAPHPRRAPAGDPRRRGRAPRAPAAHARLGARRHRLRVRRRRQRRGGRRPAAARRRRGAPGVLDEHPTDELIVADSDSPSRELLEIVEHAHRRGVKVRIAPKTTELLVERGEYVPGPGRAAVRAAAAGLRRRRLGGEAHVRPRRRRRSIVVVGLPLWLVIAAAIKLDLARPGLLPRPAHRPRRAAVRDAQVPDDGRRRRRAAGRARARERGRAARSSRSATTRA